MLSTVKSLFGRSICTARRKTVGSFIVALVSLFFVGLPSAWAGYLRIGGTPRFDFSIEGDLLRLVGEYTIRNDGNETAQNVFPHLELGSWTWAGEPRPIKMNEASTWRIEEEIPLAKLSCESDSSCAGEQLSQKGLFPLRVMRHYQDVGGHSFTVADVLLNPIGLTDAEAGLVQVGDISATLTFKGDGEAFQGAIKILNSSGVDHPVALSVHTSRELEVKTPPQKVVVPAHGSANAEIELKNFSGNIGSEYNVEVIFQWNEDGVRHTARAGNPIRLSEPSINIFYLTILGVVVGVLLLLLYLFVFRTRSNSE